MIRKAWLLLPIVVIAATAGVVRDSHAEAGHSREALLKAAFVYNFAKFIEWPASAFADARAPLVLCIFETDPFLHAFMSLQERSVRDRQLLIRPLARTADARGCHILFLSAAEEARSPQVVHAFGSLPVLTVADIRGFAEAGGVIDLIEADNKLRFEINIDAAQRAGLRISSQLLNLARIVETSKIEEKRRSN